MKKLILPLAVGATLLMTTPAFAAEVHTVKPSDTLSQLAIDYHTTIQQLMDLNPKIKDPNLIYDGDVLVVSMDDTQRIPVTVVTTNIERNYVPDDLQLLAHVVNAEAEIEPYAGKVAVAKTVLNRVANPEFPNSIRGVIYEPHQFETVSNGMINRTPTTESIRAAKEVLNTYEGDPNGYLYFYDPRYTSDNWIRTRKIVYKVGHQVFAE